MSARQDDDDLQRRRECRRPREAAVGGRFHRSGDARDRDGGAGHRLVVPAVDDAAGQRSLLRVKRRRPGERERGTQADDCENRREMHPHILRRRTNYYQPA